MTLPPPERDGLVGQVLIELGKISTQIAVMAKQMEAIPDHENRIRVLEKKNQITQDQFKKAVKRLLP